MALLTLDKARRQLAIESTTDDDELQDFLDGMTETIEGYIGAVEQRTVTETQDGSGRTLCLRTTPVVSLTGVTPILSGGAAVDVSALHLDGATGVIRRLDNARWAGGPWTVVYEAGRPEIPAGVRLAARILLQHLWRTRYGAARGNSGADDYNVTEGVPGWGYAVPNRVLELLDPLKLPPGMA